MAQLVHNGQVLSEIEIADSFRTRLFGLMGRRSLEGAMYIKPAKSIHTFFMRFPIDVAFVDSGLNVVDVVTMSTWRIGSPRFSAQGVIEAQAGSFSKWGVTKGDLLEVSK